MTTDKGRNKRRKQEAGRAAASVDPARPVTAPGPRRPPTSPSLVRLVLSSREACGRLLRWKKTEADTRIRRRRAHVNDVLRVARNVAALVLFFSGVSVLVAYAGIRMGVPPEICWIGSVTGGPMLVRTFIKLFETLRPALPDAPEDPPSSDAL
ncbi:hypothetical protein ACGF3J_17670 [Streptomyces sp. NPDC048171]|uniref:hypothetical protein n=1 Tax=unclassified Streptomyces TaxID=2593676 RepID=UPI001371F138|nr:hypothetical protein [Streptomyces sp. SID5789]MZE73833.1 hypothetical protein [Streptomyces sp. SID5789]